MIVRREILGRDQIATVECGAGRIVGKRVILAARLGTGAAIGRPLRNHPGHEALPGVRDAERTVHKCLEAECRDRLANAPDVFERVLACQHDALDTQSPHDLGAAGVVYGHLRTAVDLQLRVDLLYEPHDAQVLNDGGVDTAIDALTQIRQRPMQFGWLDQHVEGEIDPHPAPVRDSTRLRQFIKC